MSRLHLPDITLVMIETRAHELARLVVRECSDKIQFGEVLILTDKPEEFDDLDCKPRFKVVSNWPHKLGWSRSWWFDVPMLLRTSQTLNVQWDSSVWDVSMWREEFLQYDFCGAPWGYRDGKNVGNGGFSLVSSRLKRYIYDRRADYPCDTDLDDDLLCRKYRPRLEEAGFRWAPEPLAHDFAFECCRPSPTSRHFGFHAMFNWPVVLDHETLLARLKIAFASPAIRDSFQMQVFCQKHPQIIAELKDIVNAEEGMSHASDQCLS